jgi:hypothetical protein
LYRHALPFASRPGVAAISCSNTGCQAWRSPTRLEASDLIRGRCGACRSAIPASGQNRLICSQPARTDLTPRPARRGAGRPWRAARCQYSKEPPAELRNAGAHRSPSGRRAALLPPTLYIDVLRNVALVGVLDVVVAVRFPSYSLGTRDVSLADVFRILKQGLDFFLYNASVFGR